MPPMVYDYLRYICTAAPLVVGPSRLRAALNISGWLIPVDWATQATGPLIGDYQSGGALTGIRSATIESATSN
jgi:hypothetical protein